LPVQFENSVVNTVPVEIICYAYQILLFCFVLFCDSLTDGMILSVVCVQGMSMVFKFLILKSWCV